MGVRVQTVGEELGEQVQRAVVELEGLRASGDEVRRTLDRVSKSQGQSEQARSDMAN